MMTAKILPLITTLLMFGSTTSLRLIAEDELHNMIVKLANNELEKDGVDILRNIFKIYTSTLNEAPRPFREKSIEAKNSLDCLVCRSLVVTMFDMVHNGQSDDQLVQSLTILCSSLSLFSYNTCHGFTALNIPIFSYIIRNTPEASPQSFCGLFMQNADGQVCSYEDPRFEWEVDLPERNFTLDNNPVISADARPLTIALISDIHVDPYYEPYSVADCDEYSCCRKGQRPRQRSYSSEFEEKHIHKSVFKVNNEVVLDVDALASALPELRNSSPTSAAPAGYWGDYRNCNTPIWAFNDVIDRISSTHKDIDIVYYIGDSIDHHIWATTYDMNTEVNNLIIDKMRKSFGDNVLIVPAIGNHESQPTNQFAPSRITGDKLNSTWLYAMLANKWSHYLPEQARAQLRQLGSFSMLIRPNLRVISLNNNVAYKYNWWLQYDPVNPKEQLNWLVGELYKAELANERVHILTHIPPGVPDLIHTWTREYNKIINRFSSIISAEFNGHTHSDEFKIYYSSVDGAATNVAWGAGSATTYNDYNLNYKITTVDSNTLKPLNIVNYIYNLTEANMTPNRRPHWFQLYDMKNSFELQDLSPTSMDKLVHDMVSGQKYLLDLYSAFYFKISDTRWPHCNEECKIDNLCKTVVTVLWERQKCEELRQLYFA